MKEITVVDYTDSCNPNWTDNTGTVIELISTKMKNKDEEDYTSKVVVVDSSSSGYCVCLASDLNCNDIELSKGYARLSLDELLTFAKNLNDFVEFKLVEERYLEIKNSLK
jgi:hypothetical protein